MRLLRYLEIENFKRFGDSERIELNHPTVLVGPNNCGKTAVIQALALWSQAVRTWQASKGEAPPRKRTSTALNRLRIVAVPVPRTRFFWHDAKVREGNQDIPLVLTVGVEHGEEVRPVSMRLRNHGDDLVYCTPDEETLQHPEHIREASGIDVHLLYPMSGLEPEETILQPGRIDVLLGRGQTAQVLRNLCLLVYQGNPDDWHEIASLTNRLFGVLLGDPVETPEGTIELSYRQDNVKEQLEIAMAGRGFQQLLLVLAYLYSHPGSVLLIDEPDAHLEILRQKQVYVLLKEIASRNKSQVILATHSEVILQEAFHRPDDDDDVSDEVTHIVGGHAERPASSKDIQQALKYYGAEHYLRARQRGYVLYVEGRTDIDMLRAMARKLDHPASQCWDERINAYYVQSNFPNKDLASELARVEGGFGLTPRQHFFALRSMLADLAGLAILDSDQSTEREDSGEAGLTESYWKRYELENYFVTPELLMGYVARECSEEVLRQGQGVLDELIRERVFDGREGDLRTWQELGEDGRRLVWETKTERVKLSDFAEEFFRRLARRADEPMLLRKGELYRLVDLMEPASIPQEVSEKLDLLAEVFTRSRAARED